MCGASQLAPALWDPSPWRVAQCPAAARRETSKAQCVSEAVPCFVLQLVAFVVHTLANTHARKRRQGLWQAGKSRSWWLGSSWGGVVGEEGNGKMWPRPGWKEGGRKEVMLVCVAGRACSLCYTASGRRPWQAIRQPER